MAGFAAHSFLDPAKAAPERRGGPSPRRRGMFGVLLIAGLTAGLGLGFHQQWLGRDAAIAKPGPRRYPPASRHLTVTPPP